MGHCHENEARYGDLSRAYARALLHADEIAAERAVRDAIDAKLTTAEIDEEIIAPALWLVGELWERGELSIADEHIAAEISIRMLAMHREAQRVVRSRWRQRVLLATPGGEHHVVALRMIADLLREAGYAVIMLGSDVPPGALAESAERYEPEVICLSSTMPGGADAVLACVDAVIETWPNAGFVLGGRSLTSRVRARPRLDVCERVGDAVEAVDAIVKRADLN
jgi:methanogenic corrinoid protein MtbC1